MRRLAVSVAVALVALASTVRPVQAAETTAAQCDAMLDTVDDARVSLEQMETTLADLDAEIARDEARLLELQVDLRFARMGGNAKLARKLAAEKSALEKGLALSKSLRKDIANQVAALRHSVGTSDREYIACIEQTIARR